MDPAHPPRLLVLQVCVRRQRPRAAGPLPDRLVHGEEAGIAGSAMGMPIDTTLCLCMAPGAGTAHALLHPRCCRPLTRAPPSLPHLPLPTGGHPHAVPHRAHDPHRAHPIHPGGVHAPASFVAFAQAGRQAQWQAGTTAGAAALDSAPTDASVRCCRRALCVSSRQQYPAVASMQALPPAWAVALESLPAGGGLAGGAHVAAHLGQALAASGNPCTLH